MRFDIMTLFPEMVMNGLETSIIGRAVKNKILEIEAWNIRDYAFNKHSSVDDYPYGGGAGMLMQAEPVYLAYDHMPAAQKATPFVVLSLQACQTEAPVFRSEQETVPFSATVTVTLLMPIETHAAELSGTFTAEILPVLMQQQNLQTVQLSTPKTDRLLNRQTITATCQLFGYFQSEMKQTAIKEDV